MAKAIQLSILLFCGSIWNPAWQRGACLAAGFPDGWGLVWNGTRLTGELVDAPVMEVLKGLIESESFACRVEGTLEGTVNLNIVDLSPEAVIRQIMRKRRYDYTLILTQPDSSGDGRAVVSQLTIYQGSDTVRFVRRPRSEAPDDPRWTVAEPRGSTEGVPTPEARAESSAGREQMLEELDQEIKSLLEEMVAEDKISRRDYDDALRAIDGK